MIVRLLGGDGQFRVDDGVVEALNELDAPFLGAPEERRERRPRVDEDGRAAGLVGDEIGVREPARIHAPLDQHRR